MPLAIVGLVIGLGALSLALLSVFGGDLTTKARELLRAFQR